MVDAYQDITLPFQMSSREFFRLVKEHLKDGGVMAVNMNMQTYTQGNINEYLQDTIASEFSHVYTVDVPNTSNRELFATENGHLLTQFPAAASALPDPELRAFMLKIVPHMTAYTGGNHVLTDDKAPVELLGMKTIDALIQNEIGPYRKQFEQEGFSGLLK